MIILKMRIYNEVDGVDETIPLTSSKMVNAYLKDFLDRIDESGKLKIGNTQMWLIGGSGNSPVSVYLVVKKGYIIF